MVRLMYDSSLQSLSLLPVINISTQQQKYKLLHSQQDFGWHCSERFQKSSTRQDA